MVAYQISEQSDAGEKVYGWIDEWMDGWDACSSTNARVASRHPQLGKVQDAG